MKTTCSMIGGGSWIALSALACGLAIGTMGCGAAQESTSPNREGEGRDEKGAINDAALAAAKRSFPAAWAAAQTFVGSELQGRVFADVKELYRPDVEGPAYLDFALLMNGENAGHVTVSTAGHDFPIISWNDKGTTRVRSLEQLHAVDLSTARVYMLGFDTLVAELPDGSALYGGARKTRESWASAKAQVVRTQLARQATNAERAAKQWRKAAKNGGSLPPDVQPENTAACCADEPCTPENPNYPNCSCGGTVPEYLVRGADILIPPNYLQFARVFADGSYCRVGCTPNSFAMIGAWASHQAGDHRDGSVWSHPRMAYAFQGPEDAWGPPSSVPPPPNSGLVVPDDNTRAFVTELRIALGTECWGTGENEVGKTWYIPYDRISNLSGQYFNQIGAPLDTFSSVNSSTATYRSHLFEQIVNKRVPVQANGMDSPFGSDAHSWIIWGFKSFGCYGTAYYKVNTGNHANEWVNTETVLDNLAGAVEGQGIVMFKPKDQLWRDHGPITTGAGSQWCLDPTWSTDVSQVVQYTCHGGDNQLWYLDRAPGEAGWHVRNKNSGLCLAPEWNGTENGLNVVQWPCDADKVWKIEKHGNRVALKHANGRCLDLDNAGGMAGDFKRIQVWDCNDGANQLFDFAY